MIIYNHNIYIMIKIVQILFNTCVYVESCICKYVLSHDDNHNENNHYDNHNEDNHNKDNHNEDNHNEDNHNEDNEYTQSVLNKFQRCNWCGNYIDTKRQIIYLYMDKTFCNIKCRNNQIEEDRNKN